jgi:hypothetical protein
MLSDRVPACITGAAIAILDAVVFQEPLRSTASESTSARSAPAKWTGQVGPLLAGATIGLAVNQASTDFGYRALIVTGTAALTFASLHWLRRLPPATPINRIVIRSLVSAAIALTGATAFMPAPWPTYTLLTAVCATAGAVWLVDDRGQAARILQGLVVVGFALSFIDIGATLWLDLGLIMPAGALIMIGISTIAGVIAFACESERWFFGTLALFSVAIGVFLAVAFVYAPFVVALLAVAAIGLEIASFLLFLRDKRRASNIASACSCLVGTGLMSVLLAVHGSWDIAIVLFVLGLSNSLLFALPEGSTAANIAYIVLGICCTTLMCSAAVQAFPLLAATLALLGGSALGEGLSPLKQRLTVWWLALTGVTSAPQR